MDRHAKLRQTLTASLSYWTEFKSERSEILFEAIARLYCMTHNVEGLTSFLEAAHNYDFPVWYIYDAGLKIATGTNWDPAMNTGILDYDASWMPEHLKRPSA